MESGSINRLNQVVVPVYELDEKGYVKPNPLFHRPYSYLHSRCVEYPFAALQLGDAKKILDVGTVKSDLTWISWLECLPFEVHATDYDEPFEPFRTLNYHKGDLRNLPIENDFFDRILAVSVIEHVGLSDPQVVSEDKPVEDPEGDLVAFKELLRMLKKGGSIVMTFPFGTRDEIVLGSARNYTIKSIEKFNNLAEPTVLDYYEYQHINSRCYYSHADIKNKITKMQRIKELFHVAKKENPKPLTSNSISAPPGVATWRRIPIEDAKAEHITQIDGVLCGVWRKP